MKSAKVRINSFSEFLSDPLVSMALFSLALVALFLSVLEFRRAIS